MNRLQKMAIFNLIFIACVVLLGTVGFGFIIYKDFWNFLSMICSIGCLCMVSLLAVQSWPNSKKAQSIQFDERDQSIQIKSLHAALWGFFGTFLWMMWLAVPGTLAASIALPILLVSATIAGFIVYSLAILFLYKGGPA